MKHWLRRYWSVLSWSGLFLLGMLTIAGTAIVWHRFEQPPRQPLPFSHRLHAGRFNLCSQCHRGVSLSPEAGVPGLDVCLECHTRVAAHRPEIKTMLSWRRQGREISWQRVYEAGWHVHFNHKRHIRAGKECRLCHGEVKALEVMRQKISLRMGWCVTCHRQNKAAHDCWSCHK